MALSFNLDLTGNNMNKQPNPDNNVDDKSDLKKIRSLIGGILLIFFSSFTLGVITLFSFLLPYKFVSYLTVAMFSFFIGYIFGIYSGKTIDLKKSTRAKGRWRKHLVKLIPSVLFLVSCLLSPWRCLREWEKESQRADADELAELRRERERKVTSSSEE